MERQPLKTDSQIKKAMSQTTKTTAYPIAGFTGLEINIRITKKKNIGDFRHRYTHPITGKRTYMTLGTYPAFTLEQARKAYNDNLALLADNTAPLENRENQKKKEILERKNTLNIFIDEWIANNKKKNLAPKTYEVYNYSIDTIRAGMGGMKVTDIKPSTVIDFIHNVEKNSLSKADRVKKTLKSILQIAKARGVIEYNPASDLKGVFISHNPTNRPAIVNPNDFAILLREIDQLPDIPNNFNKQALQLLALLFTRVNDLCAMKWSDIDFNNKVWHLTQQKANDRRDMMKELDIPLPPQAITILENLKALTGDKEYVFYNARRKKAPYLDNDQLNKVLNNPAMNKQKIGKDYCNRGYFGVHCIHGFRASAKTNLKRLLSNNPFCHDMTELQLGHRVKDKFGGAYDRYDLFTERTAMMNQWANYLDQLKAGEYDNVIYLDSKQTQTKLLSVN